MSKANDSYIQNQCRVMSSQGYLLTEISNILGISCFEVYNNIANNNSKITTEEERALFIELRESGMTYRQIAKLVGRSMNCVRNRILKPAKYIHPLTKHIISAEKLELLKKLYKDGNTMADIARLLDMDADAVRYRIVKCGIHHDSKFVVKEEEKEMFIKLYKEGWTIRAIAAKCHRSTCTVSKYVKQHKNSNIYE